MVPTTSTSITLLLGDCLATTVMQKRNFSKEKLLSEASKCIDQGFKAIKMRLGRETLKEDLDRIDAMRNHLPDEIALMADANEAWRVDQAVKAFNEIEKFHVSTKCYIGILIAIPFWSCTLHFQYS